MTIQGQTGGNADRGDKVECTGTAERTDSQVEKETENKNNFAEKFAAALMAAADIYNKTRGLT